MEDFGGGLTRNERARRESMAVRMFIVVMVWNGLLRS